MTTICYKKGRLVTDGMEVHGDYISSLNVKKIVISTKEDNWTVLGKRIVAFAACGTATADITIKEYLSKGIGMQEQFINVCHDEFSVLCVDEEGTSYTIDSIKDDGVYKLIIVDTQPVDFPIALGVGNETARSLMGKELDYTAYQAVKFNCGHFTSCGGAIQQISIAAIVNQLK